MEEREIHLRDYLRVINKRKSTVFTFFIITVIIVVIASFTATPIYRASSKVVVERNTSSPLSGGYRYTPYDPEFLETQYQIIKSGSVAEKVVDTLDPEKMYDIFFTQKEKKDSILDPVKAWCRNTYAWFKETIGIKKMFNTVTGDIDSSLMEDEKKPLSRAEKMKLAVKSGIGVEPLQESRVIEISYTSENPALAAKIANAVAQSYIYELMDMRMEMSGYSIKWMTTKADDQKKKLEKSEIALQKYNRKNDIVTIEDKMTVIPERLSGLSLRLTQAETERKELSAVYNQIKRTRRSNLETIPVIAEDDSVASMKKQIIEAEQNISELSKKYGRKHPTMISAKDELRGLKQKKEQEIDKVVQTIKNRYELAVSNEDNLRSLLEDTKFDAANLNEKYIQQGILKREVETNRHLYNALITKLKEKRITEESQSINVWILEKSSVPEIPVKPRKKRNILLAVILGLFGGIGLAFFFEYLDNTIKSPEDVEEGFDIPVIGTIGLFRDKYKTIVENVIQETTSIYVENFTGLRTSVFLSSAAGYPRSLLVTSMSPGEGKSSVCTCLGVVIARTGRKTIIIDADMRRPVQHKNTHVSNENGLSTFLAGVTSSDIIQKGPVDNLDIISSGPVPPNPSELLSSPKMKKLIARLLEKYEMVIIDSPPSLNVSDPLLISRNVEGVAIVAMSSSTTHEILHKGVKAFREIAAPITGIVLNRFDAKKSGYYYGYGDYYYSSETSAKDKKEKA